MTEWDVVTNFEKMTDFYVLEGENASYPRSLIFYRIGGFKNAASDKKRIYGWISSY